VGCLTRSTLELLSEHDELDLIVDGQDTSSGDTTENVGTGTLEERLDTLGGDNLLEGIERRLVLDGLQLSVGSKSASKKTHLSGSHHHATTDGIKRIRADTSTSGDTPSEQEGSQEVTLERTD
jgi:hypothetical protein